MTSKDKKGFYDGVFGRYILPGVILQSVLIGGGYATGSEVVAYGGKFGAMGWLGGLGIFIGFTVLAILTFELARLFKVYDYKLLVQQFIGKFYILYDVLYILLAILIIAIMASATGEIVKSTMGLPYWIGVTGVIIIVGILNFYGGWLIERFETYGTIALYIGYIIFGILVLSSTWGNVQRVFMTSDVSYVSETSVSIGAVLWSGILYVGYNLAVYPATLFTLKRQTKRKETICAAIIAGLLMTIPWFITYFSLMGFYPSKEIIGAPVPWLVMLQGMGRPWIIILFGIVVGWTLIETSTGMIHALVERINSGLKEMRKEILTRKQNAILTVVVLITATFLSKIGIIDLVSKGYTIMAYGMIAVYALPLLTIGLYRIINPEWKKDFWNKTRKYENVE
ncbi:hypothetical protein K8M07_05175 [Schnuerera sp. xch1]|uniref:YkvI family membrane protein n=1 Tax=Schnuerera sp. xch1 TaxID=2874283 RepID=UPI001CBFD3D0|nr:hypothetical protein [Schnuerera sp. xch1]MBZ2174636.1 hypothetical protein [Schnuerera sp. xch1]